MEKNHITDIQPESTPITMEKTSFRWLWWGLAALLVTILAGTGAYYLMSKKDEFSSRSRLQDLDSPASTKYSYPKTLPEDARLLEAIQLYRRGFQKKSEEILTDITESAKPSNVKSFAYVYLGLIADERGKFTRAVDFFRRAIKADESNYYAWYNMALALRHRGSFKEALEALEQARKLNPQASEAGILKGALEYDMKNYEVASKTLEEAGKDSDNPLAMYNLGVVYKKQGKIAEAKAAFLAALEKANVGEIATKSAAQLGILFATDDRADLENAIFYMKKAVKLSPANLKYRYNLALLLSRVNQKEEALKVLEEAPEASFENPQIVLYIAQLYQRLGKPQKSARLVRQAVEQFPSNADIRQQAADIAIETGRWSEAEEHLKKVLELTGSTKVKSNAWFSLGKVYSSLRQFDKARDAFEKAYDLDTANEDALVALGDMELQMNRGPAAIKLYKEALKINPDNLPVLRALAKLYFQLGFLSESELTLKQALSHPMLSESQKPEIYLMLGEIYEKRKIPDTAIRYLQQAASGTDSAIKEEAYLRIARIQLAENEPSELVLQNIEKAIALRPNNMTARLLLAKTLIRKGSILSQERAEEELSAIIESAPSSQILSKALTMRGILFYRKGMYIKALDDFNRALEADPSNTEAFENKRVTAARLENNPE